MCYMVISCAATPVSMCYIVISCAATPVSMCLYSYLLFCYARIYVFI